MEGRNVSRGIGSGAAQIYSQTQNAVNTYARTLAQQQAKREAEQKALQDDLSKVKIDGIRQGDIPEFNTKYNEAKDIYAKLSATRNNAEKIQLDRDFKTRMLELNQIAQDSKALAKGENEFSKILLNPNIRDRYTPDAVERFQRAKPLSRNDPNYIRDLTKLEQQVDLSAIMKDLDERENTLLKSSKWNRREEKGMQGNRSGVFVYQERSISPQDQAIAYGAEFDLNPKFRVAMRQMFPQLAEASNEELKQVVIPELVKQRQKVEYAKPEFKEDDDWMEKLNYREGLIRNRPSKSGEDEATSVQPITMNIPFAEGKGVLKVDDYIPIPMSKKNFAGSNYIEMSTGRPSKEPLPSSGDYEIVGVANFDVIKSGSRADKKLWGAIAQPEFARNNPDLVEKKPMIHVQNPTRRGGKEDLLIPYDRMSKGLTKNQQTALSSFVPATSQPKPTAQSKKYSATQEKLISDNLKANPAYTREEIIQALGL